MKLLYSLTSPYARKVRVLAREVGVVSLVEEVLANPFEVDSSVARANPLGKIPALILSGDEVLYDSRVICEYLDSLHQGPRRFPAADPLRWSSLRMQALGDGCMDAVVASRIESLRPEAKRMAKVLERSVAAIRRALSSVETDLLSPNDVPSIGEISFACALGYMDLRLAAEDWRSSFPQLRAWFETFDARPSMQSTAHPS